MKNLVLFAGIVAVLSSCSPSQNVARNARYYKRKEMNANGPLFPGSTPCCVGCLQVHF